MFKNLTRGAQTLLHAYRNIKQITNVLILWFIISFVITDIGWIYNRTNQYDYYVMGKLIEAKALTVYSGIYRKLGMMNLANSSQRMDYQNYNGLHMTIYAYQLLNQPGTENFVERIKVILYEGCLSSAIVAFIFITLIGILLNKRGKQLNQDELLRGASLSPIDELNKQLIESDNISNITIANVHIPKNSETQHTLITGTTGAGKTVCMSAFLSQIRRDNKRAIVYDHVGVFAERFYRPGKDIILNPLDNRSPIWNIWGECKMDVHYDAIAESLIPMPTKGQDPFWIMAARIMLAVAARRLKQYGEVSTTRLLRYLLMADLNRIQELIANTEAEALASEKAEKMALSVKAVLSTYLRGLRYLKDGPDVFSIRDWVANDKDDSWIFITSREDQHATLKPLIATFLDIAANAILSLQPDYDRRIYLSLDEIDSLQCVPSIIQFLTKSRKYGGCGILGIQAISQFYKNYGEEDAETIISCCNTGVHFRSKGTKTAKYIAELLGESEIKETNENISFGIDQVKDGISITQQKHVKQLILPSQIKQLEDLEAYLQLKGNWPITKIKFDYITYSDLQPNFIARPVQLDNELENTIKQIRAEAQKQGIIGNQKSAEKPVNHNNTQASDKPASNESTTNKPQKSGKKVPAVLEL